MQIEKFYTLSSEEQDSYIQQIEYENNDEKWSFLVAILKNPDVSNKDFNLLAIDILKILEIAKIPSNYLGIIEEVIVEIIKKNQDDDIKNYALIASKNFINKNYNIRGAILDFLQSNCEDLTLRFNALNSFKSLSSVEDKVKVFTLFKDDEQLQKYVNFFLNDLL